METLDDWVLQIKNNHELLKNVLSSMTSDPELCKKMIHTMKSYSQMEIHLKSHSAWMDSIHQLIMDSGMGQGIYQSECTWCSHNKHNSMNSHVMMMSDSNKMMEPICCNGR